MIVDGYSRTLIIVVLSIYIAISAVLVYSCSANKSQNAVNIADALQNRLSDSLSGKFSSLTDSSDSPDGDTPSQCCEYDDPCGYENDGICQCPDQYWDEEDCIMVGDGYEGSLSTRTMDNPVCATDFTSCVSVDQVAEDEYVIDRVELGWFDDPAPLSAARPDTLLCFDSPHNLTGEDENSLVFGFDPAWDDVAAFLLKIDGVEGYGLLPIDSCGVIELPGISDLCPDDPGFYSLKMQGAIYTFDRIAGPYLDFELSFACND